MRPKFVFGLVLAALVIFGAVFLLKQHATTPVPAPVKVATQLPAPGANDIPPPLPITTTPTPPPVLTPEQQQDAIDAEIDRLQDWSRNNDPQSLSNILADLNSPQKDIREAAIEAAKQFGSTNAIPALKAAAVNSTDTDEQIEMLQAVNFLMLPPIDFSPPTPEHMQAAQQRRAQMKANQQAQTQGHGQNPNAQTPPPSQPAQQ
jgi:hypothetical protein